MGCKFGCRSGPFGRGNGSRSSLSRRRVGYTYAVNGPRVAMLTREYPPEVYGGAGVHVAELSSSLASLIDLEVHAFGGRREDASVIGTYQPWTALEGDAPHRSALRTMSVDLAMVAAVEGADLLHSHTWYTNLAGHLAGLTYGIPHVMTAHSLEPLRPWKAEQLGGGYALSTFCERTAVESADAVIAVSGPMRDDVLACYPAVDPERVHVVHNGVDAQAWQPDHGTDVLRRLGIDAERPSVVFVGRITRQKGLPHLLDAVERIDPSAQVVLLAGAPDTPELASEVRGKVNALDSSRSGVVWVEEMLPRPDVRQVLTHATVFVCPSVYEPFGLVNAEAMACGTAVVASAVGGIPEVVVDGETGLLVGFEPRPDGSPADPARFASDLSSAIDELLADPGRATRMGAAGRLRVLEHFDWEGVAQRTVQLYRSLLGRR